MMRRDDVPAARARRAAPRIAIAIASAIVALAAPAAPARADDAARGGLLDGPSPAPIQAPSAEEIRASIARGVAFLIEHQEPNGAWGSPRHTKGLNIYAPAPGAHHAFRSAVTGLCVAALVELDEAGLLGESRDPARAALARARRWMLDNLPALRRATPDAIYNVWGHAYGIQGLVRLLRHGDTPAEEHEAIRGLIADQIALLHRYESVDGGWGYYDFRAGTQKPATDSTSFTTATILVAFDEARRAGIEAPPALVARATASIVRQRKADFSYLYGEYLKAQPMRGINRPGGSLGRSQACNYALRAWGDARITDEVLLTWLDRLFARNLWLDIGRKRPVPHEAWFQVAGYFYYYGHYYAALCIDLVPEAARPRLRGYLAHTLLARQEKNGSWWDYPFYDYHEGYGTAFALLALRGCVAAPEARDE